MSEDVPKKNSGRRAKKKQQTKKTDDFDDSDIEIATEPNNDSEPIEEIEDNQAVFDNMTEEEMAQHLKLCMKLSVENKINMKNAFGLHLIEIMQNIVKKVEPTNIQQASLSLQASSKIYAGRVEALYQETCRFHGQLQSITAANKKDKKSKNADEDGDDMMDLDGDGCGGVDDDDDESGKAKSKPQKNKCKKFLKAEESLTIGTEISSSNTRQPHGNFVTISSAFSTSRQAPKLVNCMQLLNDSCILRCAVPVQCFKLRTPMISSPFPVPPKLKSFLEHLKNFNVTHSDFQVFQEGPFTSHTSTPKALNNGTSFFGDDHPFEAPCNDDAFATPFRPPPPPENDADVVENAIERFDDLNITADALVNDIFAAVTNDGIDHNLLPPNSALKKMLDRSSRRSTCKPSVGKSTRKKG